MSLPRFRDDRAFLNAHGATLELRHENKRVLVSPRYQGRVMTSAAAGDDGASFGWINRDLIASGVRHPIVNAVGGEDRLWIGPQAGRFSMFHAPGTALDVEHYQTPEPLDGEPWEVTETTERTLTFQKRMTLRNHFGTVFEMEAVRIVRLLKDDEMLPDAAVGVLQTVGFESINTLKNVGDAAWARETGLPSLWVLGMFPASDDSHVGVLISPGHANPIRSYFGPLPDGFMDVVSGRGATLAVDGRTLAKVGIPPGASPPMLTAYDPAAGALTLVHYIPPEAPGPYVNSRFETPHDPYDGDAINVYNDGPASPGGEQIGRFYELETSSPGAALAPGEEMTHIHRTVHIEAAPFIIQGLAHLMTSSR
jgi:hypothetical protein